MAPTINLQLDLSGASEGMEEVVRRMRAGLRQDQLDLRRVASPEGWFVPFDDFDRAWADTRGQDPGLLTVLEWNRLDTSGDWPRRSFEFIGETSPLYSIFDLSLQHDDVDFRCKISISSECGAVARVVDGVFTDGEWAR